MNAFCLVWMLSICKSCKVQNQAIKKDCTLHYLYISLGHSENIRHIIFGITDIMPFRKSTNSLYILPSPGNCPTSQLISPPPVAGLVACAVGGNLVPVVLGFPPFLRLRRQNNTALPRYSRQLRMQATGLASPLVF